MESFNKKKGQATIFIIAAVVIVAAIGLVFILSSKGYITIPKTPKPSLPAAQEYIGKCAIDAVSDAIKIMLPQGGYISPENYRMYQGSKVGYLCYNRNYYYPCINQEPMYIEHVEQEIIEAITPVIDGCFNTIKDEYRSQGYEANLEDKRMKIELKLKPGKVDVRIKRYFQISKGLETIKVEEFETFLPSRVYDLSRVAVEIINGESSYCHFSADGFSLLYPRFLVYSFELGDGNKIYIIEDKNTKEKLQLAIRSCVLPAGR